MNTVVQARLDEEAQQALAEVIKRNGWSTSRAVREGLRLLVQQQGGDAASRMIGIGMFASGVSDMGSNKKYLEGLGSNSGISRKSSSQLRRKAS
jgi:hypothetical protein